MVRVRLCEGVKHVSGGGDVCERGFEHMGEGWSKRTNTLHAHLQISASRYYQQMIKLGVVESPVLQLPSYYVIWDAGVSGCVWCVSVQNAVPFLSMTKCNP